MSRVVHFDISALDPEKLIDFYKSIFNWKFEKWGEGEMEYWLIDTGTGEPGINGGMSKRQKDNYVMITLSVDDMDKATDEIKKKGGKILFEKSPIPGVGYFAQFEDPDGNMLGLMQSDKNAK